MSESDGPPITVEPAQDGVAVVVIDRPPLNLFDFALIEELTSTVRALGADPDVRAVVLASTGRNFCAGANMRGVAPVNDDGRHIYDVAVELFDSPIPIVAAVQGGCIGGGLALALVADFRVADTTANFMANFARLGFHHGFGLSATLPRAVGVQWANRLLYTSCRIDAATALAIGLCDELVAPDELRSAAVGLAVELAAAAPLALQAVRRTMRDDLVEVVRVALAHERAEQDRLMATADFAEGVAALTERRAPRFVGA